MKIAHAAPPHAALGAPRADAGSARHSRVEFGGGAAKGAEGEAWMEMLSSIATRVRYAHNDVVIVDGQASDYVYRLASGVVRVEKGPGATLLTLQPGDVMGELSFLDARIPPCASCVVDSDVAEIDRVPKATLRKELDAAPHLAGAFYRYVSVSLARRLRAVARTAAETREASSAPAPVGHLSKELTAKQLRKQRSRFGVPDHEAFVAAYDGVCVVVKLHGLKVRGTLFVFEAHVGFLARVLALTHAESVLLADVEKVAHDPNGGTVALLCAPLGAGGAPTKLTVASEESLEIWTVLEAARQKLLKAQAAGTLANGSNRRLSKYAADPHRPSIAAGALGTVGEDGGGDDDDGGAAAAPSRAAGGAAGAEVADTDDSELDDDQDAAPGSASGAAAKKGEEDALRVLLAGAQHHTYSKGDAIVTEGSAPHRLFQIANGTVSVLKARSVMGRVEAVRVHTLHTGAYFCEMSLLSGEKAMASIVAESATVEVYSISAQFIEKTLAQQPTIIGPFFRQLATYLAQRVRLVTRLTGEAVDETRAEIPFSDLVSNAVMLAHFEEANAAEGWAGQELFALLHELTGAEAAARHGEAELGKAARRIWDRFLAGHEPLPPLPPADGVEDESAQRARRRAARAKTGVTRPGAKVSAVTPVLDELSERALGALEAADASHPLALHTALAQLRAATEQALEEAAFAPFAASVYIHPLRLLKRREATAPSVADFTLLRILGEGYEGKVLQARKRDCGVTYALKVLDKEILASRSRRWKTHASNERRVLIECEHPNIVSVGYCFQSARYLYFALEYLPSTTLGRYIEKHSLRSVPVEEIRFIAAQIVLALAHMHSRSMIYRDLKPANVLLDGAGHVRLVDMGMAVATEGKMRHSVCGTQRYMAPEMKNNEQYDASVDWYALGKMLLDFSGRSGRIEKHFKFGPLAELIEGLLRKRPAERLGCTPGGVAELKAHPFFAGLPWEALERKQLASPLNEALYRVDASDGSSMHFKNGDDVRAIIEKLQHIKSSDADGAESGPGMIEGWEFVNSAAVYSEYKQSPFHNLRAD